MNRLHFNENAANFRNLPIQPYTYRTPTPPPITPGLMSPVGSNMWGHTVRLLHQLHILLTFKTEVSQEQNNKLESHFNIHEIKSIPITFTN